MADCHPSEASNACTQDSNTKQENAGIKTLPATAGNPSCQSADMRPADQLIDCASPPCLLHELGTGNDAFTH